MSPLPSLIVVSGPAGASGKTTLAHELARAVGPVLPADLRRVEQAQPAAVRLPADDLGAGARPVLRGWR